MAIIDSPARFEIGRVVSRTFGALAQNVAVFLPLALLMMIPLLAATLLAYGSGYTGVAPGAHAPPGALLRYFGAIALIAFVYVACTYTLQAAIVQGTVQFLNGEKPTIGACLAIGIRMIFPILLISILSVLGMMAGFVLLIVPGIIVALGWSVVIPVRVIEQTGISETFGRSWNLTKGHRGKIFLIVLMYFLVALLVQTATKPLLGISLVSATDPRLFGAPFLAINWAVQVLLSTLTAVGVASIYYELRLVKEGVAPQQLASAFD